ncbi:hypothetical protein HED60_13385 [Planctomycetales bacterium ZRK34]|nr:hypothetical protein HED60_13385 [Planctomycetales bacterium ZRK34]
MRIQTNVLTLFAAAILCMLAVGHAQAGVIYREVFPNNTANNDALSTDDWQINSDAGALAASQVNSPTTGSPTNQSAVNSNPDSAEISNGYAFNNDANGVDYLIWTDEYTVDRTAYSITSISWYQANESTSDVSRAAIQIGSQWYASSQTFQNTSAYFGGSGGELMSLDFASANWLLLDFTDGSSLALGSAASLPGGDITAFGVYYDSKVARLRLDTYAITAIPTPAALPAGLGMLAMIAWRRR